MILKILAQVDLAILVAMSVLTASFVLSVLRLSFALVRSGRKS